MKTKKIILTLGVFAIAFLAAHVAKIYAGTGENVTGWAWGGSNDGNATGAGIIPVGVGAIAMNNLSSGAGGAVNYGINIPSADGPVTGYAWSSNVGWIDFAPHDGCPGSPKYEGACESYPQSWSYDSVRRSGNNLVGWARFIEISKAKAAGNSGGYDGWIKMDGVSISGSTFQGFAWAGDLGAIGLSGATIAYKCTGTAPDGVSASICAGQDTLTSGDMPYVFAEACDGTTRCQAKCNPGYGFDSATGKCLPGACVNDSSTNYDNTILCGAPQNSVVGNVTKGLVTEFNTCDGATDCQSTCNAANPTRYEGVCQNCTIGDCGIAVNEGSINAPTTNLCDSGAATTPQLVNNNWTWTCGTCGGGASCSTNKIYDINVKDWKEVSL